MSDGTDQWVEDTGNGRSAEEIRDRLGPVLKEMSEWFTNGQALDECDKLGIKIIPGGRPLMEANRPKEQGDDGFDMLGFPAVNEHGEVEYI